MNNRIMIVAARFLAYCMVSCTSVLFVVLRLGFCQSPYYLFSLPESFSGPKWFAVLTSVPTIPFAILLCIFCLYGMWREAKIMRSTYSSEQ